MNTSHRKTILLVEDEAVIALMQKKQLEKKDYVVHHVSTGEKAVQATLDTSLAVDLVLLDIDLGEGIDGTEAAEKILQEREIPVVFLSSHTDPEIVEKTEKITSFGYVVKNSGIVVLDASIKMAFKLFDANVQIKLSNDKLERTIEDLRVHQFELKMQNEELCEKQAEIEALRLKYTNLYDFAPFGYYTLSETGTILEANITGAELLGLPRSELLKQQFTSFVCMEDQDKFYMHRKVMFKACNPQVCELRMRKADGSTFFAYMKSVSEHGGDDSQTCRVIMIEQNVH